MREVNEGRKKMLGFFLYTLTCSKQHKEEIWYDNYCLHFSNDHRVIACIFNYLPPLLTLSSASISADGCFLPGEMTQSFIPEESGLSCNFPLTLITEHGNGKTLSPWGYAVHSIPYCHCGEVVRLRPWLSKPITPVINSNLLRFQFIHRQGEPKLSMQQS
jgi:hypothetical protein